RTAARNGRALERRVDRPHEDLRSAVRIVGVVSRRKTARGEREREKRSQSAHRPAIVSPLPVVRAEDHACAKGRVGDYDPARMTAEPKDPAFLSSLAVFGGIPAADM